MGAWRQIGSICQPRSMGAAWEKINPDRSENYDWPIFSSEVEATVRSQNTDIQNTPETNLNTPDQELEEKGCMPLYIRDQTGARAIIDDQCLFNVQCQRMSMSGECRRSMTDRGSATVTSLSPSRSNRLSPTTTLLPSFPVFCPTADFCIQTLTLVQISWPGSFGIKHTQRHEKTPNPCYPRQS